MRTNPVERSTLAECTPRISGCTTPLCPFALLVAYLFYNIANQDGCANIIATGTQRILTQTPSDDDSRLPFSNSSSGHGGNASQQEALPALFAFQQLYSEIPHPPEDQ